MSDLKQPNRVPYPDPERPRYFVTWLRILPGRPCFGVIIAERPLFVWTHWYDNRSWPHLQDQSSCEGCKRHNERRLSGFAQVTTGAEQAYGCLRYSALTWHETKLLSPAGGDIIRGYEFRAQRLGRCPTSPLSIRLMPERQPDWLVRQPYNLAEFLCRQWGRTTLEGVAIYACDGEVDTPPPEE